MIHGISRKCLKFASVEQPGSNIKNCYNCINNLAQKLKNISEIWFWDVKDYVCKIKYEKN